MAPCVSLKGKFFSGFGGIRRSTGSFWPMLVASLLLAAGPAAAEFRIDSLEHNYQEEIADAAAEGKRLILMFHYAGCPYCDKMRARVFPDKSVDAYFSEHFVMIETDIKGDIPCVAPSGEETTMKQVARKLRVRATPVFVFFDKDGKQVTRATGYMDPKTFIATGEYVVDEVYKTGQSLARYHLSRK